MEERIDTLCPVFTNMLREKCSGCEACVCCCPTKALYLQEDSSGFLYPEVDNSKCIKCGKCTKICPMYNTKPTENESEDFYGASHVDNNVLLQSASGGMFTFLVNEFKKQYPNGFVVGVIYDASFKKVMHIMSNQEEDILKMKSSKYFQSNKGDIYRCVKEMLEKGEAVFFTGTPCEVAALRFLLGNNEYERLWTMDFICKGSSSPRILRDYISYYEKKMKSKVTYVNMRYKWPKLDNWIPQFIMVKFANGKKVFKEFYNTELGIGFQILQRDSCHTCPYREKRHFADFTIGDLHGAKESSPIFNKLGVSIVAVNTGKAHDLWEGFDKSVLRISSITKDDVYGKNRNPIDTRSTVLKDNLKRFDSVMAVRKSIGIKEKIKMRMPVMLLRRITSWRRKYKNEGFANWGNRRNKF